MKIGIVASVYINCDEHLKLAWQTMESIKTAHEIIKIAVVNKADRPEDKEFLEKCFDVCITNDKNILCRAWNIGIQRALELGCEKVLVINTDIKFRPESIDNLIEFGNNNPDPLIWSGQSFEGDITKLNEQPLRNITSDDVHFSAFLVDDRLFNLVGMFDEQFAPVYYEDCDMGMRVKLAGHSLMQTCNSLFWHYGSASYRADNPESTGSKNITDNVAINREKYIAKWGGEPGQETYLTPYNNSHLENLSVMVQSTKKVIPMRVAIDMRSYAAGGLYRGIGEYTRNILAALQDRVQIILVGENKLHPIQPIHKINATIEYISDGNEYDVLHIVDPMSVLEGIDSSFRLPIKAKVKTSVFFDGIPLLYEGNGFSSSPKPVQAAYYSRLFGLRGANAVFAISEAAAGQYEQIHQVRPLVANIGIEPVYIEKEVEQECPRYIRPYILTIGGADPHKGIDILIEAYLVAKTKWPDLTWVVAGKPNIDHKKLENIPGVYLSGYLTRPNLLTLIKNAQAVCMPSYIEGLGLPAYETALLDRPVLVQDIPAFKDLECKKLSNRVSDWVGALTTLGHEAESQYINQNMFLTEKYNWGSCAQTMVDEWRRLIDDRKAKESMAS